MRVTSEMEKNTNLICPTFIIPCRYKLLRFNFVVVGDGRKSEKEMYLWIFHVGRRRAFAYKFMNGMHKRKTSVVCWIFFGWLLEHNTRIEIVHCFKFSSSAKQSRQKKTLLNWIFFSSLLYQIWARACAKFSGSRFLLISSFVYHLWILHSVCNSGGLYK